MRRIMKCPQCGKYTMKDECCVKTINSHPPKYSPQDKYAKYRRMQNDMEDNQEE